MSLSDMQLKAFGEALASKSPIPGGGGATALVGALGAALCSMSALLTKGKPKFSEYEDELCGIIDKAQALQNRLHSLLDADAEAFAPLAEAYRLPKDAPGRDETLEKCLRAAAQPPMEMLKCACEGIALHERLEGKCSALSVSDVGTGVIFCWAALYGGAMNVRVNTHLMKDRAYAEELNAQVDALMGKYWVIADEVYERIWKTLG